MTVTLDALRESIERHNDTFESLLNIIPARFYISREPDEAEVRTNPTIGPMGVEVTCCSTIHRVNPFRFPRNT